MWIRLDLSTSGLIDFDRSPFPLVTCYCKVSVSEGHHARRASLKLVYSRELSHEINGSYTINLYKATSRKVI